MKKNKADESFMDSLKGVKKYDSNPIAFGSLLEDCYERPRGIKKSSYTIFEKFRKQPEYKLKFKRALKRIREMVRIDTEAVKKHGYYSSKNYVDKDFHEMWKRRLKYMEREAKFFKL